MDKDGGVTAGAEQRPGAAGAWPATPPTFAESARRMLAISRAYLCDGAAGQAAPPARPII